MNSKIILDDWSKPGSYLLRPDTLTVLASYRCTAACENCCFDSNPSIKHRLSYGEIVDFISEGLDNPKLKLVVFSGGECFLLGDDLTRAVAFCTAHGIKTRCVTNGYWAKDCEVGRRRLSALRDAGLCELNISTGDFHQQYVSHNTVVNAACLSNELIGKTVVVVELRRARTATKCEFMKDSRIHGIVENSAEHQFKVIESPWMPMNYREVIEQEPRHLLNKDTVHLREGCTSIFSTLVLTPHKRIGLCCGLTRERIQELNEERNGLSLDDILDRSGKDFMKIWLSVDGPEKILAWAASIDPTIDWENRYSHNCHVCLALFSDPKIRRVIADHYRERIDDVLMRYVMRFRLVEAARSEDAQREPVCV